MAEEIEKGSKIVYGDIGDLQDYESGEKDQIDRFQQEEVESKQEQPVELSNDDKTVIAQFGHFPFSILIPLLLITTSPF